MACMQCPVDGETLLLSERQGVEIDYCPKCRGVWLDRGELDKLLSKEEDQWREFDRPRPPVREDRDRYDRDDDDRYDRDDRDRFPLGRPDQRYPRKKKKGFLSEVFDFD